MLARDCNRTFGFRNCLLLKFGLGFFKKFCRHSNNVSGVAELDSEYYLKLGILTGIGLSFAGISAIALWPQKFRIHSVDSTHFLIPNFDGQSTSNGLKVFRLHYATVTSVTNGKFRHSAGSHETSSQVHNDSRMVHNGLPHKFSMLIHF